MGYRLMCAKSLMTKEEAEVIDTVNSRIADIVFESETGMPAITQWMPPADQMAGGR